MYLAHHELESVVVIIINIMSSAGQVWILCHVTFVSIIIAKYKVLELQGSGQEHDDIAELEALWLSSQGQQRAPQSSLGLKAIASAGQHCHIAPV